MRADPISIIDVIKKGDISASLITTFNATFPYYEDFLLRRLASVGCRNNVLLADQRQLSVAYQSEATRPRRAGFDYTLVPIDIPGAFHPKLCILAGKRRASLFVGSHNMTVSGFGYNREVTNHLEFLRDGAGSGPAVFSQAWSIVREWIASMSERLPSAILDSAFTLDATFGKITDGKASTGDAAFIAQSPGQEGLLDQIARFVSGKVKRILVVGAFFDARAEFLVELLRRWPQSKVVVGIDPSTVWMMRVPSDRRLSVVDASRLGSRTKQKSGYLHAKAIFIEVGAGRNVFASGSANPSKPAWLSDHEDSNVEAILVRTGAAADQCARTLGLYALSTMPPVTTEQVRHVAERSRRSAAQCELGPRILVGVANYEQCAIIVRASDLPEKLKLVALNDSDTCIPDAELARIGPNTIRVTCNLSDIRSVLAVNGDVVVARVLVHHSEVIARRVLGTAREPAIDLLRQLGSVDADISRILPHIEKLIFAEEVANTICLLDRPGKGIEERKAASKPVTLEVPIAQMSRRRRPSLFAASSDLATLIDVLTSHISIADEKRERGFDASGRSEEEQIGQDDEESESILLDTQTSTLSDTEVADQVRRRVGKLCQRMVRSLQIKPTDPKSAATLVVQLVAVLAVLQELECLSLADRWRRAHLLLLPYELVESLFATASSSLFSPGDPRLLMVTDENSVFPEELHHLYGLMLWLAWWCGAKWTSPLERIDSPEKSIDAAKGNGRLVRLLTLVGDSTFAWEAARRLVDQTLAPTPMAAVSAKRWFERHQTVSERLAALPVSSQKLVVGPTLPGDVVRVPLKMEEPTVAVGNDGKYVLVIAGGEEKGFLIDRVIRLARI
jgi:hypothetical protein